MLVEAAETFFADLRTATRKMAPVEKRSQESQNETLVKDAALSEKSVAELEKEFKRIVQNVCQEAAARRNEIAHGVVIRNDRGSFLQPSYRSSRHRDRDLKPAYSYTSKEIEEFRRKFGRLSAEVMLLAHRVYELRGFACPPTI
jgi:hypothetical protein